jgi:hypothetical protein
VAESFRLGRGQRDLLDRCLVALRGRETLCPGLRGETGEALSERSLPEGGGGTGIADAVQFISWTGGLSRRCSSKECMP